MDASFRFWLYFEVASMWRSEKHVPHRHEDYTLANQRSLLGPGILRIGCQLFLQKTNRSSPSTFFDEVRAKTPMSTILRVMFTVLSDGRGAAWWLLSSGSGFDLDDASVASSHWPLYMTVSRGMYFPRSASTIPTPTEVLHSPPSATPPAVHTVMSHCSHA